jgi:hypothetical protein
VPPRELVPVKRLRKDATTYDAALRGRVFRIDDGRCTFLQPNHLCGVHAKLGVQGKPATCRKFPFSLVATPEGRRVATSHRCSCRTMGDRAPLDPLKVEAEIRIEGEPLRVERSVLGRVPLGPGRSISFTNWRAFEQAMLDDLAGGRDPARVIGARPFPPLRKGESWRKVGAQFLEEDDDSAYEVARGWVGEAILHVVARRKFSDRERPWAHFFDGAERRSKKPRAVGEMLADWVSDLIWSFDWIDRGSFERARPELATRLAIVKAIGGHIATLGVRPDRAMAEALMMIDAVGTSEHWDDAVALMSPPPMRGRA